MAWQEIIRDSCFRLFFHDSRKKLRWWLMGWCKASTIMNYFIQLKCKKLVVGKDTKTRNLFILRTNFLLLIKRFNYICQQLLQCFPLSSSMRFSGTANPLVCMYLWKHHREWLSWVSFLWTHSRIVEQNWRVVGVILISCSQLVCFPGRGRKSELGGCSRKGCKS